MSESIQLLLLIAIIFFIIFGGLLGFVVGYILALRDCRKDKLIN